MSFLGALGEVLRRVLARIDGHTLELEALEASISARLDVHMDELNAVDSRVRELIATLKSEPPLAWLDKEKLDGHAKLIEDVRGRLMTIERDQVRAHADLGRIAVAVETRIGDLADSVHRVINDLRTHRHEP